MKNKVMYIMLFVLILILSACSNNDTAATNATGEELKIAYPAQPPVLDPHISSVIATTDIMGHVFETLITVNKEGEIVPLLAESFEQSEDGKVITFHLKEGVTFHNGKEMTAEDVVSSMERWKDGLGARNQFDDVVFKEIDTYEVVAELPEPSATALFIMSHGGSGFAAIMPKEEIDALEGTKETEVKEYIGTGPFEFIEWSQDQHVKLSKNEEYHNAVEGNVNEIIFSFTPDSSTQVAGIQSGEYDIAFEVPYDNVDVLMENPSLRNIEYPDAHLLIHFNKKSGLFKEEKARQAILSALDLEEILVGGFADEKYFTLNHNIMLSHQLGQWDEDAGKDKYNQKDTDKAKELLKEIGYQGEEITILTDREYEEHYNASIVVQDQLKALGMEVNLEAYDWPTATEKRSDENAFDIFIMGNVTVPEPTSTVFMMNDYSGWTEDEALDQLIQEFRTQPSIEDAKDVYTDIMQWFYDYVPVVKVGDYNSVITTTDQIDGVQHLNRLILEDVKKE